MLSARLRENPLLGLIWLEVFALFAAFSTDTALSVAHVLNVPAWNIRGFAIYSAVFGIAVAATMQIPHRPNRRYLAIPIAVLAIAVLSTLPQSAFGPAVLLMVLGSRITFAFGFRGAAIGWLAGVLFLLVSSYFQYKASTDANRLLEAIMYLYGYALLLALIFGVMGITWLYSSKASANAAGAERVRIALDIHDSLGHGLTTLAVQLQNAERFRETQPQKSAEYLKRAVSTSEHLLADVRETVAILHDDVEQAPAPFPLMLQRLRSDFESASTAKIKWNTRIESEPSGRLAMTAYRVLQEALTNVMRHARASGVEVNVRTDDENVEIRIADDGDGFDLAVGQGHGLASMRSRVEAARGSLTLTSKPGAGTTIQAWFPIERGT